MIDDCIDFSDSIELTNNEYYNVCSKKYLLASDIDKVNFHVSAVDLKPDDNIELEHSLVMNHDNSKVYIKSKTITFKDLCKAIAEQFIKNDLTVEDESQK